MLNISFICIWLRWSKKKMMRNIDAKFKKPYNNCNLRKIIYHQYLPMFMSIFNLMGAQTDRFRYEVFQNLFLSPMNTVFLRDAVATVLTVYGIETGIGSQFHSLFSYGCNSTYRLRYWNLLKIFIFLLFLFSSCNSTYRLRYWNYGLQ